MSVLGHLTARTSTMRLGSAILQLGTSTPVAIAQAAITLSDMSDGRFSLGLGPSGPQVIEGPHGVAFGRPLQRADGWLGTSFVPEGAGDAYFYNAAYSRQGWADVAAAVREAWQGGDRGAAAELITDEMVLATTLIGTESMVRARLAVWRDSGVDTVHET